MSSNDDRVPFVRLRASGRDRAKFLHNFCTNNIKSLTAGQACEAFFTDVKARILAHGYVLALEDCHEIWVLSGDPEALRKHLNRYIITEDVTVEFATSESCCFAFHETPALKTQLADGVEFEAPELTAGISLSSLVTVFRFTWFGNRMLAVCGDVDSMSPILERIKASNIAPISPLDFERLRIQERFPIMGTDMSGENLAPEAERNSTAISYTKGCYLGQEPIARLDAMGHVNRALRVVEIVGPYSAEQLSGLPLVTAEDVSLGTICSVVRVASDRLCGLAMIRLAQASRAVFCVLPNGEKLPVVILSP